MRKLMCFLFFYLLVLVASAQQNVSNGGLENWINITGGASPDSFVAPISFAPDYANCAVKTTSSHSGQYAALLQTDSVNMIGMLYPGYLSYGTLNTVVQPFQFTGYKFNSNPEKMKFWYKYEPALDDTGFAFIALKGNVGQIVATGYMNFTQSVLVYSPGETSLTYFSSDSPDTIEIFFVCGAFGKNTKGTKLYIDDISLEYGPAAVTAMTSGPSFSFYPNPCTNLLNITSRGNELYELTILDIRGAVMHKVMNIRKATSLDVSDLSPGLYQLRMQSGRTVYNASFIKS